MSENKYTVTFRMAQRGDFYDNPDDLDPGINSAAGHLWYVLRKNGEFVRSAGFHSVKGEINGDGEITPDDEKSYRNSLSSITIQINQQQFDTLYKFGDTGNHGANAKAMGFEPKYYRGAWHNCVGFVAKALHLIGYNPNDIEYDWTWPVNGIEYLRNELAYYGAIEVKDNKLSPVNLSRSHPIGDPLAIDLLLHPINHTITGYDDNSDEIWGGEGNDTLIGKSGDDILNGGEGKDIMEGGAGHDIYYIGGNDAVIDEDGKGEIRFLDKDYHISAADNNKTMPNSLSGLIDSFNPQAGIATFRNGYYRFEAKGIQFIKTGSDSDYAMGEIPFSHFSAESLTITDIRTNHRVTIQNFVNEQLNITLSDAIPLDGPWHALWLYETKNYNLFDDWNYESLKYFYNNEGESDYTENTDNEVNNMEYNIDEDNITLPKNSVMDNSLFHSSNSSLSGETSGPEFAQVNNLINAMANFETTQGDITQSIPNNMNTYLNNLATPSYLA